MVVVADVDWSHQIAMTTDQSFVAVVEVVVVHRPSVVRSLALVVQEVVVPGRL